MVVTVLAGASLVVLVVGTGLGDALLALPWLLLLVVTCWAFFWRPCVTVSDAGVRLVNVTRTVFLPWPTIRAIDTRFALSLVTEFGRHSAWAAPAPGAGTALRSQMRMRRDDSDDPTGTRRSVAKGDLEGTPSGDAAAMVRRRWEHLRSSGYLDDPKVEHRRAPITWHWRVAALVVVLGAACVATLFLG